jgi:hypothetical protein
VRICKQAFPLARVHARSYDRRHTIELRDLNVDYEVRETFESALTFGSTALRALDLTEERVASVTADVRDRDEKRLEAQRASVRGDVLAGREQLYGTAQVTPQPLTPARRADASRAAGAKSALKPGEDPSLLDGGAGL